MTDTNTLAYCPFCGGAARRSIGGTGGNAWFGTGCGADQSCPAHLRALVHRTQAEADATWNRRAPTPAATEAQPVAAPSGAAREPLTDAQIEDATAEYWVDDRLDFRSGVMCAERHHGIRP